MARTDGIDAEPEPIMLVPRMIRANGLTRRSSVLMVRGKTLAPGARRGKYLHLVRFYGNSGYYEMLLTGINRGWHSR
jgi:hypothetical protein